MRSTPSLNEVAQLWRDAIPGSSPAPDSGFFAIGGDSLAAAKVVVAVKRLWGVSFDLAEMFEVRDLADFHRRIATSMGGATGDPTIPISYDDVVSPSLNQTIRLRMDAEAIRESRKRSPHNVVVAYHAAGSLDLSLLETALDRVVRRHAVLRSVFLSTDEVKILPRPRLRVDVVDAVGTSLDDCCRRVAAQAEDLFDPTSAPPWSTLVQRRSPTSHVISLAFDHLIMDGQSLNVLVDDLIRAYLDGADESEWEEARPSYYDWAAWQRRTVMPGVLGAYRDYLSADGGGDGALLPTLRLTTDRALGESELGLAYETVPAAALGPSDVAARRAGCTLFQLVLLGFALALEMIREPGPLVVVTPVSNRRHPVTAEMVGWLSNPGAVVTSVDWSLTFGQALSAVKASVAAASEISQIPLRVIQEHFGVAGPGPGGPPARAHVALETVATRTPALGDARLTALDVRNDPFLYPGVSLWATLQPDRSIELKLAYDRGKMASAQAQRLLARTRLAVEAGARTGTPLTELRRAMAAMPAPATSS